MTKQEAIEDAQEAVLEQITTCHHVKDWNITDDSVHFLSSSDGHHWTTYTCVFEPEMIPNVTRCEVWNKERPVYPTIKVFAGYSEGRATFYDGCVRHLASYWPKYKIISPDSKDKEIDRLRGLLADDHHRQAEHIEKLCEELEPFRPKISLDALYDAHAKGETTKLKTYKELEEEIKRLKEK